MQGEVICSGLEECMLGNVPGLEVAMWAPCARLDGELGESLVTLGAELYVPVPGGPCLSKRDSSLNNSSK